MERHGGCWRAGIGQMHETGWSFFRRILSKERGVKQGSVSFSWSWTSCSNSWKDQGISAGCWVHTEQAMPALWCGTCYPMYKELLPMTWPSLIVLNISLFFAQPFTFVPNMIRLETIVLKICVHVTASSLCTAKLCLQLVEMLLWQC